jgi:hypothetical protein
MRHFYRTQLAPAEVLAQADRFFPSIGVAQTTSASHTRTFAGPLGALKLAVRAEGGHYTFVQVETDQMGESRMDRNVKQFFVGLHRSDDPSHAMSANY